LKPGITSSIGIQIAGPCQRQILIKAGTFFFPSPPHYFLNLERRRDRWREFSLLHKSALSHESHSNCGFIAPRASVRIRASSKAALRRGFTWLRSSQCRLSPLFSSVRAKYYGQKLRTCRLMSDKRRFFFCLFRSLSQNLIENLSFTFATISGHQTVWNFRFVRERNSVEFSEGL
jgi:hypothetical protein